MGRFSGGIVPTGIGSTTLPMHSIFASASVRFILRQLIIVNSTSTEVHVGLRKFTAQGTAPDTGVEVPHDVESAAASATMKQTHTVTPTFVSGTVEEVHLAAAIGATMGKLNGPRSAKPSLMVVHSMAIRSMHVVLRRLD